MSAALHLSNRPAHILIQPWVGEIADEFSNIVETYPANLPLDADEFIEPSAPETAGESPVAGNGTTPSGSMITR